jgi:ABC-2 type transport system permease protein
MLKLHRIWALAMRHILLYRRSPQRVMEILYWPVLDLLLWGFITVYLAKFQEGLPRFVAFFLGALILWDILFRAQQGVCITFLEEVWSRNLLNLFVSPLRPIEYLASTMLISLLKVTLASLATVLLAYLFYGFNLFVIGISLIPFVLNLIMMGWSIGIFTTAIVLRYGQQAEVLAWGLVFLVQPFSAVFYPVSVLPHFLQVTANYIPAAHVFEGMRAVVAGGDFPFGPLVWAFGLNLIYFLLVIRFFYWIFGIVRRKGLLVRVGE